VLSTIRALITKILPKGKFARGITILSSGTLLGQGLAIIASPLLTRIYDPSDFGGLAIFISILSVLVVVVSLKYQMAIPLDADDGMATNLLALSVAIVFMMTFFSGACLFFFGDELTGFLKMQALKPYLWTIPVSLFGAGIYQALQYWAIRKQDFQLIAQNSISKGIGTVSTQIAAGLLMSGPLGLLLGDAVGRISGSGVLLSQFWKNDRKLLKNVTAKKMKISAFRYKNFPLISSLSGLINTAGLQVAPIMLASFYDAGMVGWFSLTQRVIGVPMQIVGTSVSQVYLSEMTLLKRESPEKLRGLFISQAKKLALFGGAPILLIGLSSPLFFSFIFGAAWEEAGRYAQILSIMFSIQFVVGPLSQTLTILECQVLQFFWDVGRLLLVIGTIYICAVQKYSALAVIELYSLIMSAAYLLLIALAYHVIKKPR
jgi:O-antigen/teichoic acid export membrane protein